MCNKKIYIKTNITFGIYNKLSSRSYNQKYFMTLLFLVRLLPKMNKSTGYN